MRIAYLLTTFPSISESFALREIQALQRAGVTINVFAAKKDLHSNNHCETEIHYRPTRLSSESFLSIIKVCLFRPIKFLNLLGLLLNMSFSNFSESLSLIANIHTICDFTLYLERNNIKHLHAYFLSWPALMALGIKTMSGVTISISAHSRDIFVESGDIKNKVKAAKFITVCTANGIEVLKSKVPKSLHPKFQLSYHGLRIVSKQTSNTNSTDFEIITVGRLVAKKGYFVLLEAFAKVHDIYPNITLKIIGDGELHSDITRAIKKSDFEDHVSLVGWQSQDDVIKAISRANVLVVPSVETDEGDMDGIPNVILEAFSQRTPVVASNIKTICEVIEDGVNGTLFKMGDSNDLADKIEEIYNSDKLRRRLVNASETLTRNFDIDKNIKFKAKLFAQCQINQ